MAKFIIYVTLCLNYLLELRKESPDFFNMKFDNNIGQIIIYKYFDIP